MILKTKLSIDRQLFSDFGGFMNNIENVSIDELVEMLDNFSNSETGRLKVKMSDEEIEGGVKKEYHHGRCDINSPWACGASFDVLE